MCGINARAFAVRIIHRLKSMMICCWGPHLSRTRIRRWTDGTPTAPSVFGLRRFPYSFCFSCRIAIWTCAKTKKRWWFWLIHRLTANFQVFAPALQTAINRIMYLECITFISHSRSMRFESRVSNLNFCIRNHVYFDFPQNRRKFIIGFHLSLVPLRTHRETSTVSF